MEAPQAPADRNSTLQRNVQKVYSLSAQVYYLRSRLGLSAKEICKKCSIFVTSTRYLPPIYLQSRCFKLLNILHSHRSSKSTLRQAQAGAISLLATACDALGIVFADHDFETLTDSPRLRFQSSVSLVRSFKPPELQSLTIHLHGLYFTYTPEVCVWNGMFPQESEYRLLRELTVIAEHTFDKSSSSRIYLSLLRRFPQVQSLVGIGKTP